MYLLAQRHVLTSAFTGMKQKTLRKERSSSRNDDSTIMSLTTSPSLSTIEFLKKNDHLSVKIGRKGNKSHAAAIRFAIHQVE